MKKCQRCKESLPLERFSKNRSCPDGLQQRCKACNAVDLAAAKARDPEKVRRQAAEREVRFRAAHPERKRESYNRWRETHIEQERARARETGARVRAAMTEADREARRAYDRARYLANREPAKARALARHYANREAENARCREYYRTHGGVGRGPVTGWAAKTPAERRAGNQEQRIKRLGLVPGPGSREHVIVLCSSDQVCVHCGKFMPGGAEHVDHLVPLCAGGLHVVENLGPSCGPCNAARPKPRPRVDAEVRS